MRLNMTRVVYLLEWCVWPNSETEMKSMRRWKLWYLLIDHIKQSGGKR